MFHLSLSARCRPGEEIRFDWGRMKSIGLWTLLFGLVAYGYLFFNANFSHDSMISIYEESPDMMLSFGRFLRPVYRLLRGKFLLPAVNGFLTLVFLWLSTYFVADILKLQKKLSVVLTCAVMVTNSTVSLTNATYLHDADAYGLCLLLAVLGVWAALRLQRGELIAAVLYFLSLGIYQAYIQVAVYLLLILALVRLLKGEKVSAVYGQTFRHLLCIAAAMVVYFIAANLIQRLTHVSDAGTYNSVGSTLVLSAESLRQRAMYFAEAMLWWFVLPVGHSRYVQAAINALLLLFAAFFVISAAAARKLPARSVWGLAGVIIAIPFGMSFIIPLSNTYHYVMMFSFNLTYICVLVLAELAEQLPGEKKFSRAVRALCTVLVCVMVYDNCLFANEISLKKQMENDATLSAFTRIIDRMEQTEGYVPGQTPVAILGLLNNSDISASRPGFRNEETGLWFNFSTSHPASHRAYLSYYLGYPADFVTGQALEDLKENPQIIQMPAFPAAGSIQMVDGVMVIKLSMDMTFEE